MKKFFSIIMLLSITILINKEVRTDCPLSIPEVNPSPMTQDKDEANQRVTDEEDDIDLTDESDEADEAEDQIEEMHGEGEPEI